LIEWPERLGGNLPAKRLDIGIAPGPTAIARRITLSAQGGSDWPARYEKIDAA
jgi:tRNA A37 threonylcarbamoyladenosine biosynthesis protein TsaE